jgi:hypothetical protein
MEQMKDKVEAVVKPLPSAPRQKLAEVASDRDADEVAVSRHRISLRPGQYVLEPILKLGRI